MPHQDPPDSHPKPARCPVCGEPVSADAATFPFCSARCKMIDLGKWLRGDYVISRPIEERDQDEDG